MKDFIKFLTHFLSGLFKKPGKSVVNQPQAEPIDVPETPFNVLDYTNVLPWHKTRT